jgi:MSHA biogenesis protein MshJ
MKAWWKKQADRIDALSLRERAFIFVSVLVGCMALADTLWIAPTQLAYRDATVKLSTQQAELQRLRDELKTATVSNKDPSKQVRGDIEAANQNIATVSPSANGGPAIDTALVQLLRRQPGLTLLSVGTVKDAAPVPGKGVSGLGSALPIVGAALPSLGIAIPSLDGGTPNQKLGTLSRRGLELKVSGSYADLVRYVAALETALPSLRWGNLQIKATAQKPVLTLQVFVVGAAV